MQTMFARARCTPAAWLAMTLALLAACATAPRPRAQPAAHLALEPGHSEQLHDFVRANEVLFKGGDPTPLLPRLDATLAEVASRYGEQSAEMEQALTDTGILLVTNSNRYDLALPYFEKALVASLAALGPDHPETGFALNDLAVVRYHVAPDRMRSDVEPLLLRAIALRKRVLGPEAKEVGGSERELAGVLLADWKRQPDGDPRSPDLERADALASHAITALGAALGKGDAEVTQLRRLQVEIALARQDFVRAEAQAAALAPTDDPSCLSWVGVDARKLRVLALQGLGRMAEARSLEQRLPDHRCGEAWPKITTPQD